MELTLEPINAGIELGLCLGALGEGSPIEASGVPWIPTGTSNGGI